MPTANHLLEVEPQLSFVIGILVVMVAWDYLWQQAYGQKVEPNCFRKGVKTHFHSKLAVL